jgi:hypothetical protein
MAVGGAFFFQKFLEPDWISFSGILPLSRPRSLKNEVGVSTPSRCFLVVWCTNYDGGDADLSDKSSKFIFLLFGEFFLKLPASGLLL